MYEIFHESISLLNIPYDSFFPMHRSMECRDHHQLARGHIPTTCNPRNGSELHQIIIIKHVFPTTRAPHPVAAEEAAPTTLCMGSLGQSGCFNYRTHRVDQLDTDPMATPLTVTFPLFLLHLFVIKVKE